MRIFERSDLKAIRTFASGGLFSKFSDEFQVVSDVGEDMIYINEKEGRAVNKEICHKEVLDELAWDKDGLTEKNSIEVGNIFKLGTRFSESLGLSYAGEDGTKNPVIMASYGIGPGRLMGTAVEIHHDDKGIIWPENIAPFKVHLISLDGGEKEADKFYSELNKNNIEVIYDDRDDKTAGEKFADADLIGCPIRLVISKKTLEKDGIEIKMRGEKESKLFDKPVIMKLLS
jgi:prolyl-tRNA synthetase